MAVIMLKYDLSENALHPWLAITEFGNTDSSSVSSSINREGTLYVWNEIVEASSLNNEYRHSRDGKIYANTFIEGYPSIPIYPSGSRTYDDLNSYSSGSFLDGLNSGSNAWNNVTPYAAYFAKDCFRVMYDRLDEYASGSSLTSSLIGLGYGYWKNNNYPWYGRQSYTYNEILDAFDYVTGSLLDGQGGGTIQELYISWSLPWVAETHTMYGIKAYENFTEYATGSNLNGQDGISDAKWTAFSGSWRVV